MLKAKNSLQSVNRAVGQKIEVTPALQIVPGFILVESLSAAICEELTPVSTFVNEETVVRVPSNRLQFCAGAKTYVHEDMESNLVRLSLENELAFSGFRFHWT